MTEDTEVWLSIREAARRFSVAPGTMRELLVAHEVPVQHLGRNLRVRESDLIALKAATIRPLRKE